MDNVISYPLIKGCLVPGGICLPSPLRKEQHWSEHIVEQTSFPLEVGHQLISEKAKKAALEAELAFAYEIQKVFS